MVWFYICIWLIDFYCDYSWNLHCKSCRAARCIQTTPRLLLRKPGSLIWLPRRQNWTRAWLRLGSSERCFSSSSRKLSSHRLGSKKQPSLPFELQVEYRRRKARGHLRSVYPVIFFMLNACIGLYRWKKFQRYQYVQRFHFGCSPITFFLWRYRYFFHGSGCLLPSCYLIATLDLNSGGLRLFHACSKCKPRSEFRRLVPFPYTRHTCCMIFGKAWAFFSPPLWIGLVLTALQSVQRTPLINVFCIFACSPGPRGKVDALAWCPLSNYSRICTFSLNAAAAHMRKLFLPMSGTSCPCIVALAHNEMRL